MFALRDTRQTWIGYALLLGLLAAFAFGGLGHFRAVQWIACLVYPLALSLALGAILPGRR
jgi:hypothetical protein